MRARHVVTAVLSLGISLSCTTARADDPPEGATRGRIPAWGFGLAGGLYLRPYSYVPSTNAAGDTTTSKSAAMGGLVGVSGNVTIDFDNVAFLGAGSATFVGPLIVEGSGGVVIGWRWWHQYSVLVSADATTNTYEVYTDKYVPGIFGPYLGAGVFGVSSTTDTQFDGTTYNVPGGIIPTAEAGLAYASNITLIAAAAVDPTRGTLGGRLRTRYVFGGDAVGVFLGFDLFGMSGSADTQLPAMHFLGTLGVSDGQNVFQ
jgi:hypothetical protein